MTRWDGSPCLRCHRDMRPKWPRPLAPGFIYHDAKGYCFACYRYVFLTAPPANPTGPWKRDELLDEWVFLRSQGFGRRAAAERLGLTYAAFDRALSRAKAAGDPRAVRSAA